MKKYLIADWKMNPQTGKEAWDLVRRVDSGTAGLKNVRIVICPPYLWLGGFVGKKPVSVKFGAQDVFWENSGAYTGEISPLMLSKSGIDYVIVGHSERRSYLKETDEMIGRKTAACVDGGLIPVICLGGGLKRGDNQSQIEKVLSFQLRQSLKFVGRSPKIVLAYEPTWAISSFGGTAVKPEHISKIVVFLRRLLSAVTSKKLAAATPIIYGGSADERSGPDILKRSESNGLLVGAASLSAGRFNLMARAIDRLNN